MTKGMNQNSGLSISDDEHIRQSIADILKTPIGSRVMRPEYGSRLHEIIDHPFNESTKLQMIAATTEAIQKWEKRVQTMQVFVDRESTYGPIKIEAQYMRRDGDGLTDISGVIL